MHLNNTYRLSYYNIENIESIALANELMLSVRIVQNT